MTPSASDGIGRNDPCPCGSGKKYKRCCLQDQPLSQESLWMRQHEASEELTRDMMRFAGRKFGKRLEEAWLDFNMSDFPSPRVEQALEDQIFMPYFLFQWDPDHRSRGRTALGKGGAITRWYILEKGGKLSEIERMFLEEATTQPLSFYEVLECKRGERVALRDVLIGGETEVIEHLGTQSLRHGDIVYAQVWNLPGLAIFGCSAPIRIPPSHKAEIIGLRKKLRQRAAKRNRTLSAEDLLRYASDVRETYLDVRDALHTPPVFCNTDGDLIVLHTLTFKIESAEAAFEALWPLAFGRRKEELLERAEADPAGKLLSIEFEWMKKGNRKMPDWDNTILGRIKISGNSLVVEVNSENRAALFLRTIEKRLSVLATHQGTITRTVEELRRESPKRKAGREDDEDADGDFLRDPEVRKEAQELLRKQMEGWVHRKIPILDGRTPMEAVQDPDGREIVESLLRDQELSAEEEALRGGFQRDINAVRKLLGLAPSAS